jgi:hypothetical protein
MQNVSTFPVMMHYLKKIMQDVSAKNPKVESLFLPRYAKKIAAIERYQKYSIRIKLLIFGKFCALYTRIINASNGF